MCFISSTFTAPGFTFLSPCLFSHAWCSLVPRSSLKRRTNMKKVSILRQLICYEACSSTAKQGQQSVNAVSEAVVQEGCTHQDYAFCSFLPSCHAS